MLKVQKPLPKTLAKKAKKEKSSKPPKSQVKETKPEKQPHLGAKEKNKKHNEPEAAHKLAKDNKHKAAKPHAKKPASKEVAATPLNKIQKKKEAKRAFKQQQLKNKKDRKHKQQPVKAFPAAPFDEKKFNAIVNPSSITKIAKALKKVVEEQVAGQKTNIFSDYRYLLNVASFKIPNCPKRMVRLNLKHSLVDKDDDVLMIVADLQRGAKIDHDETKQHYEDLFREAGIEGLTIMPFNQLRNEYKTFEAVRKLGNTYDYFLCDGRLLGQVTGFCGKVLQKPRTTVHSVRMGKVGNLKNEVTKALRRTAYKQLEKGDLISIPVGTHKHKTQELVENVVHVISQLRTVYAGGLGNVRNMTLKIDIAGTSALPLYASVGQAPDQTPYVVGPREQRLLKLKKDANEVLSKFTMTKEANIIKLDKGQVERKRKIREAKAVLAAAPSTDLVIEDDTKTAEQLPVRKSSKKSKPAPADELEPVDKNDGEEPVPKKKARLEKDVEHKTVKSPDDSDEGDDVENESEDEGSDKEEDVEDDDDSDEDEDVANDDDDDDEDNDEVDSDEDDEDDEANGEQNGEDDDEDEEESD